MIIPHRYSNTSSGLLLDERINFKLYLVINDQVEVIDCRLMNTKTDSRKIINILTKCLREKLINDEGYTKKHYTNSYGKRVYN